MKRIYTASSIIDGTALVDLLVDSGVPAYLAHANAIGALGELPVTYPEVWIKRDLDAERARLVVARFELSLQRTLDQRCTRCGETNPGSFEICWQCHSSLPN